MKETGKIIYLVTQGSYSDYGVVNAWDNEEDAEEYCRIHNQGMPGYYDEFRVEAYDILRGRPVETPYLRIHVDLDKDGNVTAEHEQIQHLTDDDYRLKMADKDCDWRFMNYEGLKHSMLGGYRWTFEGTNFERVRKVMSEKLAHFKAQIDQGLFSGGV